MFMILKILIFNEIFTFEIHPNVSQKFVDQFKTIYQLFKPFTPRPHLLVHQTWGLMIRKTKLDAMVPLLRDDCQVRPRIKVGNSFQKSKAMTCLGEDPIPEKHFSVISPNIGSLSSFVEQSIFLNPLQKPGKILLPCAIATLMSVRYLHSMGIVPGVMRPR